MNTSVKVYVKVAKNENENGKDLPTEKDMSLKRQTVLANFSECYALAYRCAESHGWRAVQLKKDKKESFVPPQGGWGATKYICVKGKKIQFQLTNLDESFTTTKILQEYFSTFGFVEIQNIDKKKKRAFVTIRFITTADMSNMNKRQHPFTIKEVVEADSKKFSKRKGTSDAGHQFEERTMASLLLNLTLDKNVKDFKMSSNDAQFGSFDDIVVDVKLNDGGDRKYAIQLKYKNDPKYPLKKNLTSSTGDFSIEKYFKDFTDMVENTKSYNLILFTNVKLNMEQGELLKLDDTNIELKIIKDNSLNEIGLSSCYKFCPTNEGISDQHKHFFDKFLLLSNQPNVQELKENILQQFDTKFSFKNILSFLEFISEWNQKDRKKKLDKMFVKKLIALQMLSPSIESFPFVKKENTEKTSLVKKATFDFTVTIVDEIYIENIKNIWENETIAAREIERITDKYQIKNLSDDEKRIIALWIINKCPLIVTESETIWKVISLCHEQTFVLLKKNLTLTSIPASKSFTKLSDLQSNSALYENITKTFYCSFQGKQEINLYDLIKQSKNFEKIVTTNELIRMLDGPLAIGERETMLGIYIDRSVTRLTIDYGYFNKFNNDTLVIISCQNKENVLKEHLNDFNLINVDEYIDSKERMQTKNVGNLKDKTVYFSKTYCTQATVNMICKRNPSTKNCHHFRITEDNVLEWMYSKDEISDLQKYKTNSCFLKGKDIIHDERSVNVITADPGMGKTELMKKLNSIYSDSFWTILIPVRDWCQYLNRKDCNNENFFQTVIESKCKTKFEIDTFHIMRNSKRIMFFWDGLDELSNTQIDTAINLISNLIEEGFKQWISCRKHLEDKLEKKFNVLSRSIKQFDENEQSNYIYERLKNTEIDLEIMVKKIQNFISTVQYNQILGIPLQIFMLTELLLNNPELYILSNEIFPVTDLYQHFIKMKFEIFFKTKYKAGDANFVHEHMTEDLHKKQLEFHKKSAVLGIIEDEHFISKLDIDRDLANSYDESIVYGIGIITGKTDNGNTKFLHFSYAEYFVALYLYENCNKFVSLVREFLFQENYQNIRFMFDLLLAKNCPAHLAVLYNNFEYLESCQDFRCKDQGGRNALQIACAWGPKFPLLKTVQEGDEFLIYDEQSANSVDLSGRQYYSEMIILLLQYNDILEKDFLLALDSMKYADLSLSLKPLLIFSNEGHVPPFDSLENFNIYTVLFYSVKFNCPSVLSGLQNIPFLKTNKHGNNILHLASENNSIDCMIILLHSEKYKLKINRRNDYGETPIYIATQNGHYELVKCLAESGGDINIPDQKGSAPIHVAAENGDIETIKLLIDLKTNLNAKNKEGLTPIYLAALKNQHEVVKYLAESGADVNTENLDGWIPIHAAADKGNLETVKQLVTLKTNVNAKNYYGSTPIYFAVQNGHHEVVKYLVESGADVNIEDEDGWIPIHAAALNGHIETVKLLVNLKANVNAKIKEGFSPIYLAVLKGHREIITYLAETRADINNPDQNGWAPIHKAVECGNIETIQLIVNLKADVNARSNEGFTPIYLAVQNGHYDVVKFLAESKADVDIEDQDGWIPIHVAAQSGHLETVKLLVNLKTKINSKNKEGFTPIHLAAQNGHSEVVKYLTESGGDVNIQDLDGRFPIHAAAENGHIETVKLLISLKTDVNAKSNYCSTPIYLAVQNGHYDVVKFLARSGADVNIQDLDGSVPIHAAAQNGHTETVKLLVNLKTSVVNAKNEKGLTPIYLAAAEGHYEVVNYLIELGADVNVQDQDGLTPIHGAAENGHIETVKLLVNHQSNLNVQTKKGLTPIYLAAVKGHCEVVTYLAELGADIRIQGST